MKTDRSERLQSQNGGNIFAPMTEKRGQRLGLGCNPPWEKWREQLGEGHDIFPVFSMQKVTRLETCFHGNACHSVLSANILPFQQSYCNKNLSICEDKALKISNVKKKIFDEHTQFSRFVEVHTTLRYLLRQIFNIFLSSKSFSSKFRSCNI